MKRILIFQGQSLYSVTDRFIRDIANSFEEDGYQPVIIKTTQSFEQQHAALLELIEHEKPLFALGFNAIGQFRCSERSIYEVTGIPYFAFLMDHPVYHVERIDAMPASMSFVGCVDQCHLDFMHMGLRNPPPSVFVPHGGSFGKYAHDACQERPIDVLFSGSGGDPKAIEERWNALPDAATVDLLFYGVEKAKASQPVPVLELITRVFEEQQLQPDRQLFIALMLELENYMRAYRRLEVLRVLDDANIAVDVFGDGWDFANFQFHRVHANKPYDEIIDMMGTAKTVLNISHMFTAGAHDRVFSAMLNGAVAVTNTSTYFNEVLQEDSHYLGCDHPDAFSDRLTAVLDNPHKRTDMAQQARATAEKSHTWGERGKALRIFFESL